MNDVFFSYGMHVLAASPPLLAYLVGMVLALSFRRRYPRPSLLTFLAMMLLAAVSLAQICLTTCLLYGVAANSTMSVDRISRLSGILVPIESLTHAAAVGLLLAAVFVGRKGVQQPRLATDRPAELPSEEHRIISRPGD
jgi:hypothetical protein